MNSNDTALTNSTIQKMTSTCTKVTNLSALETMLNGDKEVIVSLVNVFISESSQTISDFEASLTNKNWESLYHLAHKLRPSVEYLGLYCIQKQVEQVEELTRKREKLDLMPDLVNDIINGLSAAQNELKEEFAPEA